jgi:hypothetical protein
MSRIGEFSPECIGARWLDGSSGPGRRTVQERTIRLHLDSALHRFGGTTAGTIRSQSATATTGPGDWWTTEHATGCRITEQLRHLRQGLSGIRLQATQNLTTPRRCHQAHRGLNEGIAMTLHQMKLVLEQRRRERHNCRVDALRAITARWRAVARRSRSGIMRCPLTIGIGGGGESPKFNGVSHVQLQCVTPIEALLERASCACNSSVSFAVRDARRRCPRVQLRNPATESISA